MNDNTENKIIFTEDPKKEITLDFVPSIAKLNLNRNEVFKGLSNCLTCHGKGLTSMHSPCKNCVRKTSNCAVCQNTGMLLDIPGKKCKCIWGKDRK